MEQANQANPGSPGKRLLKELSSSWDGRPFGHNRHGREVGAAVLLSEWRGGSPSNTMWPGPRPTAIPSGMLIHLTVWPQYTNVTDRQTVRQDRQRSDSIGRTVFTNGRPKTEMMWYRHYCPLGPYRNLCVFSDVLAACLHEAIVAAIGRATDRRDDRVYVYTCDRCDDRLV